MIRPEVRKSSRVEEATKLLTLVGSFLTICQQAYPGVRLLVSAVQGLSGLPEVAPMGDWPESPPRLEGPVPNA